MLNVKISIEDENGKKAQIEIKEADDLTQYVIIQKVFELFKIESDIVGMMDTFDRVGRVYADFFSPLTQADFNNGTATLDSFHHSKPRVSYEKNDTTAPVLTKLDKQDSTSVTMTTDDQTVIIPAKTSETHNHTDIDPNTKNEFHSLKTVEFADDDLPEVDHESVRLRNGKKVFRLHYLCNCKNKGTHFVYKDSKTTFCHKCNKTLVVKPAHPNGFPFQDTFGNYYVGGEYQDWDTWK